MLKNTSRRNFLRGLSVISPLSYLSANAASINPKIIKTPDYFKALGVESFINAVGPYSSLGGAKMWPEVIEAMDYAITNKAKMNDLHNATGKRIAEMLGAEAAIVTSGATGAIIQGTAGCMTMGDSIKNERLPDTTGMKNEVIILKNQRYLYDRSIRAPGAILVEVNNLEELPNAINKKTAMLFYLLNRPDIENIDIETYIKIAKQYKIPIMCDAATTVPPIKRMAATIKYGFDLVCYSGGKGLRGPYSAGLLLGRKDLVEYAKQHGSPNHRAYGRSMKVAPEEYLGMMIAVETSLKYNEKAEFNRQRKAVKFMQAQLAIIPGITITINQPEFEASEPYIEIQWDKRYQITPKELKEKLRHGTPSIEIRALFLSQGNIHLTAVMLTMSEAQIVVQRINTILQKSLIES